MFCIFIGLQGLVQFWLPSKPIVNDDSLNGPVVSKLVSRHHERKLDIPSTSLNLRIINCRSLTTTKKFDVSFFISKVYKV